MAENKFTSVQKVAYIRYIISWLRAGGSVNDGYREEFKDWLTFNEVTEDEQREITEMMFGGKFELEQNAKEYVTALKTRREERRRILEESKKKQKLEVTERSIDIKNCEPAAQSWMRRLYNKRNGIRE